ncbi:MAG: hypothetical protein HY537_01940 [Deltaproteobacteria bacterium]|nr:hypothetical protein [Deltaproteobacteria bacterium]
MDEENKTDGSEPCAKVIKLSLPPLAYTRLKQRQEFLEKNTALSVKTKNSCAICTWENKKTALGNTHNECLRHVINGMLMINTILDRIGLDEMDSEKTNFDFDISVNFPNIAPGLIKRLGRALEILGTRPHRGEKLGKRAKIKRLLEKIRNSQPNIDANLTDDLISITFSFKFDEGEERRCYAEPERTELTVEELKESFCDEVRSSLAAVFAETDFDRDWSWARDTFVVSYIEEFSADNVVAGLERVIVAMGRKGAGLRWG